MDDGARQYLEAQVMTATPQKLRLMLIEGAIRFARQALELWERNRNEDALESLIRCQEIHSELTRKVAGVYLFLYRCLTQAQLRRDRKPVEDTIAVLEIERQTWRMVCDRLPDAPFPPSGSGGVGRCAEEILAPATGVGGPPSSAFAVDA
jgi:flagellar protein FliS